MTRPYRPGDGRLFWPGDARAGALMSDSALLTAMESVEHAWQEALVEHKIAPAEAQAEIRGLLSEDDLAALADRAEAGGNPVIGVVHLLRERLSSEPARWVHRGLTSQDVLDTALMICLRDVVDRLDDELRSQVEGLCGLVSEHRSTPMVGRTLTQHAVPITFGLKAASWLTGLLDAAEALAGARSRLRVQLGGAAGTLAASTELARLRGLPEPAQVSWRLVESVASALGLAPAVPWHTSRSVVTAAGDALVGCIDAYGRIATDVATLSRPEIAELAEGSGGGSSTMPQKNNPVLSVLIRRAALTGPPLASTLHLAAATNVDERPDGSWHAEWATLRDLARRTVVAASQASELITGLVVDEDRMAANLAAAAGIDAEQQAMADLVATERSEEYWAPRAERGVGGHCRAEQGVSGRDRAHHRPGFGSGRSGPWSGLMSVPRISGVQLSDPSAGPLLLLGTSIGTSASALWSASAALLGERFHVVAWDLPGHGRNTEPVSAGFTMTELAAGVLAFADRVLTDRGEPGGRLYYAGDSLGGAVGLQALLDAPDRIIAAVLLCTGAKIGDAEGWRERAARVRASGTTVVVNQSVERWFAPGFLDREPEAGARLLESLRAADAEAYALACEALADFDVRSRLGEIAVPVLAVAGAEDFATPADLLREIADGVQRGALQILDGVAHLAPAEAPQEVAKLIMRHLDAAGGGRGRSSPGQHTGDRRRRPGVGQATPGAAVVPPGTSTAPARTVMRQECRSDARCSVTLTLTGPRRPRPTSRGTSSS